MFLGLNNFSLCNPDKIINYSVALFGSVLAETSVGKTWEGACPNRSVA
jgi:hypothetical protein